MKFALLHAYFHYRMGGTIYRNGGIVPTESRYRWVGQVVQLGPEYSTVLGCRLRKRPRVAQEIERLKEVFRQEIHVDIQDFLAFCMKVIGADIGDYLKFGAVERFVHDVDGLVKDPDTGEYLKEDVSMVTLGENEQLDTSVIVEVKQGKMESVLNWKTRNGLGNK